MTQDPSAKARELHAELVGVHGDDCASMCCEDIDRFLREADQRGFERGVSRAADIAEGACGLATSLEEEVQSVDGWNRAARAIVTRIRQLLAPEREVLAHGMDNLALQKERDAAQARVKELAEQCNQREDRITELGKEAACWKAEVERLKRHKSAMRCGACGEEYLDAVGTEMADEIARLRTALEEIAHQPDVHPLAAWSHERARRALAAQAPGDMSSSRKPTAGTLPSSARELPAAVAEALEYLAEAVSNPIVLRALRQWGDYYEHGQEYHTEADIIEGALARLKSTGWRSG